LTIEVPAAGKEKPEDIKKKAKTTILDLPYFVVNKDRFEQGKIEKLSKPTVNIYIDKPIFSRINDY
jgi:hypothetical protein